MMTKGVRYYSTLPGDGYGDSAITYMECLREQGVPFRWSPLIGTPLGMAPWHLLPDQMRPAVREIAESLPGRMGLEQYLERDIDYDTVIIHCVPEIWPKLTEPDKVNIGYTVWETDRLPSHWPIVLAAVDHLCVPCEFNRELFSREQPMDVSVVPHALARARQWATKDDVMAFRHHHDIADDVFVFYLIATWIPRKAMQETVDAFMQAFTADDKVCLLIKTEEQGFAGSKDGTKKPTGQICGAIISGYKNPPKVILVAGHVEPEVIQLMHQVGDCFFSLTHSEGWGLGAFSAAASGNPVIITGWGGQLDYLPAECSYHVDFQLGPVQEVVGWESYEGNHQWAYADTTDAMRQLRSVYHNQPEAKVKGLRLQHFVEERFSIEQVGLDLIEAINEAHSR